MLLNFLTIFMFSCVLSNANAQIIKIIGFEQRIEGGASEVNSHQSAANHTESNSRYFIFAEVNKNYRIIFYRMWIKGELFNCMPENVSLPFVVPSEDPALFPNDTLVKKISGTILKLNYTRVQENKAAGIQKPVSTKEVVLLYHLNNKTGYATLKSLIRIHTLHTPGMQQMNNFPNKILEKKKE